MEKLTESREQVLKVFNERIGCKMICVLKYSQMKDVAEKVQECIDCGGMNLWSALVDVMDEVEGISVEPDCRYTQCDYGMGLAGREAVLWATPRIGNAQNSQLSIARGG